MDYRYFTNISTNEPHPLHTHIKLASSVYVQISYSFKMLDI